MHLLAYRSSGATRLARTLVEVALQYDVLDSTARVLGYRIERDYPETGETVAVGTTDIIGVATDIDDCLVIADVKTGRHRVTEARKNWQLRLLALAACTVTGYERARIAIVYVAEDGSHDASDSAVVDVFDLAADADELRKLLVRGLTLEERGVTLADTNDGEQCRYCPAKIACPRYAAPSRDLAVIDPTTALMRFRAEIATDDGAAWWWERKAKMRELLDMMDEELEPIAMARPFTLSNGDVVGPVTERGDRYVTDPDAVHARIAGAVGVEKADAVMPLIVKRKTAVGAIEKALGRPAMRQLEADELVRRGGETTRVGVTKTTKAKVA
jgi:hypothetical protein